jgi:hypothetical protein
MSERMCLARRSGGRVDQDQQNPKTHLNGQEKATKPADITEPLRTKANPWLEGGAPSPARPPRGGSSSGRGRQLGHRPIDARPNAAEAAQSREETERIKQAVLGLFDDDLAAQTVVEGDMDGIEGEELRDLTGLDPKAFATKRRFVRRRINQKYPKGWMS